MLQNIVLACSSLVPFVTAGGSEPPSPVIAFRTVAAYGTAGPSDAVTEVDVAVGATTTMAVFMHFDKRIGFALHNGSSWSEDVVVDVTGAGIQRVSDPSVAYDAINDAYVVVYMHFQANQTQDFFSKVYSVASGTWSLAQRIHNDQGASAGSWSDKPWVRAGESSAAKREFYAVGFDRGEPRAMVFARSVNGGMNWSEYEPVLESGTTIESGFAAQCSAAGPDADAPLYVAYVPDPNNSPHAWEFLMHVDALTATQATFVEIEDAAGDPLRVDPNLSAPLISSVSGVTFKGVPYLAADPSDHDRIFLVYTDLASDAPGESDLDIYCVRMTKDVVGWVQSAPVRVNNNTLGDDMDQFQPAAVVDASGRLHVVFYDGRDFGDLRHDVTYAYSLDAGVTFTNVELLKAPPAAPALNLQLSAEPPGEYPGISFFDDVVWALYSGTSSSAPNEKSVIWATKIQW